MLFYFALLLLPLVLAAGQKLSSRVERLAFILVWLALTIFIGLRREIAGDWDNYLLMFQRAQSYSLIDAVTVGDPAYMLLNRWVAGLGFGIAIVNLVCAAIFVGGLVIFVRAQPRPPLALLIAIPVLVGIGAF